MQRLGHTARWATLSGSTPWTTLEGTQSALAVVALRAKNDDAACHLLLGVRELHKLRCGRTDLGKNKKEECVKRLNHENTMDHFRECVQQVGHDESVTSRDRRDEGAPCSLWSDRHKETQSGPQMGILCRETTRDAMCRP